MDSQAFWLTIRLALLVAAVLAVVGLPVAYWITYSRWRWKFIAEAVFALPIVLRLGWLAAMSGLIFGPALGVIAGVLWASDSPRAVGNNATPAAESPEPLPT